MALISTVAPTSGAGALSQIPVLVRTPVISACDGDGVTIIVTGTSMVSVGASVCSKRSVPV